MSTLLERIRQELNNELENVTTSKNQTTPSKEQILAKNLNTESVSSSVVIENTEVNEIDDDEKTKSYTKILKHFFGYDQFRP